MVGLEGQSESGGWGGWACWSGWGGRGVMVRSEVYDSFLPAAKRLKSLMGFWPL